MRLAPDPFPIFARTGTPDDLDALDRNIEATADRLIAAIDTAGANKRRGLKLEDIKYLTYALLVHRSRRGQALSEDHLRLLHAVLRIKRLAGGAAEEIGLPDTEDMAGFYAAADLQADNPSVSAQALAQAAGVDRKTIGKWRQAKLWKARVRAVRYWREDIAGISGKDRLIKAAWQRATDKANQDL